MSGGEILADLAARFAGLSLMAFGGINTVIAEMQRQIVEVAHWMTAAEFAQVFAISQALPGPGIVLAALIGWIVAGAAGAVVATVGIAVPSSLLAYAVMRVWDRFRGRPWRAAVQNGLAPVTIGLVAASGFLLARAADTSLALAAVTAGAAALAYFTRIAPLWTLIAGGALGYAGLL